MVEGRNRDVHPRERPTECPLCGGDAIVPSDRFRSRSWDLWQCEGCTNTFVHPIPDRAELGQYYRYEEYGARLYAPASLDSPRRIERLGRLLREVEGPVPPRKTMLDVGCSTGQMMEAALRRGWTVSGIEIDPETAQRASERLGVPVLVGSGLEDVAGSDRFDLITMSHWLEHTPNPGAQMGLAREHLVPGGAVLLRVPNAGGRLARWMGEKWLWFGPPVHLQYFTPSSIVTAARRSALRIDMLRTVQGDALPFPVELLGGAVRALTAREGQRPGESRASRLAPIVGRLHDWLPPASPFSPFEDTEIQALLRRPMT